MQSSSEDRESIASACSGYQNENSSEYIESETCNQQDFNKSSVSVEQDSENSEIKQVMRRMHETEGPMNFKLNNAATEEPTPKQAENSQGDSFDMIDELISQLEHISSVGSRKEQPQTFDDDYEMAAREFPREMIQEAEEEDNADSYEVIRPEEPVLSANTGGSMVLT